MASFLDRLKETVTSGPSHEAEMFQRGLDKLGVNDPKAWFNPQGIAARQGPKIIGGKGGDPQADPSSAPAGPEPDWAAISQGVASGDLSSVLPFYRQYAGSKDKTMQGLATQLLQSTMGNMGKPRPPTAQDIGGLTQMVMGAEQPFLQSLVGGVHGLGEQLRGVQHLTPQYAQGFGNAAGMLDNLAKLSAGTQAASTPVAAWALSQLPSNAAATTQATSGLSALLGAGGMPASLGGATKPPGT